MTKDLDILVTIYNHVYGMQIKAATATAGFQLALTIPVL